MLHYFPKAFLTNGANRGISVPSFTGYAFSQDMLLLLASKQEAKI